MFGADSSWVKAVKFTGLKNHRVCLFLWVVGKRGHRGAVGGHKLRPVQGGRPLRLCSVSARLRTLLHKTPAAQTEQRKWEAVEDERSRGSARQWVFPLHRSCTLGLYLERRTLAGRAAVSRNHRATVLNHKSGGEETRKMWMAPIRRQHPLRLVSEAWRWWSRPRSVDVCGPVNSAAHLGCLT